MKRRLSLIFALSLFSTGCFNRARTSPDTLIVGIASVPSNMDPRFATDAYGMRITSLIFSSLVRVGPDFKPALDAAESWTYLDHVFTFILRDDLTFHNGRKVSVEDVEFSFQQFQAANSPFTTNLELIRKVSVKEKGGHIVVVIEVKNYSDKFLIGDLPAVKILPKKELLAAGPDFHKILIGTGGFQFVKQDVNEIHLKSVTAKVENLVFKVIRDDFTRYQKLQKGEIDLVQADLPLEKIAAFEKQPKDFRVFKFAGLTITYILVNFRDPLLKDFSVRKALDQCLDRQLIITHKLKGMAIEATSILTPPNPYSNETLKNLPLDCEASIAAIKNKGLLGKSLILKTSNTPQTVENGKVLSYQMSRSGLKVQLQSYEWATFYDDVKKGNFQLATMRWVGTSDPDIYRTAFHSKEVPPGRNRGAYINPHLDRLLEQSAAAEDPVKRRVIVREVQKIVFEDLAIIPLWYDQQVTVARKNILDYVPVQSGDFWPLLKVRKIAQ